MSVGCSTRPGKVTAALEDFRSYWIQDDGPPILVRADELRLLTGESVFVAFRRSDGGLVNTAAVKYLRTA